ncbi:MAG: tRNA ((37)-N6)-dimethylallyltransferase MiaA [Pseudomonadota bacterium]
MTEPYKTLAICGPTAVGKSELSISMCHALQGEVVNVDSVQVYRELDIGSAKLSVEERGGVPHHALDVFGPDQVANVADFRAVAQEAIKDISNRQRLPVLVGGSGMYFTVLLHGLANVPPTSAEVRDAVARLSPADMYAELQRVDPPTAERLHPRDLQRVSRAVEIARMTGRRPSDFFAEHAFSPRENVSLVLMLCRPRDELYRRINARSRLMVERGLLDETKRVRDKYGDVPALKTLGYHEACAVLDGKLGEGDFAQEIALHTRRFAKRQMTYWRNEPLKRGWEIRPSSELEGVEVSGFDSFPVRAQRRMISFRALSLAESEVIALARERLMRPLEKTEVWYVMVREAK